MNKRTSQVLSLSLIIFLSGCTTVLTPLTSNQIGANPQLDSLNSIEVGGVIYEEFNYTSIDVARLEAPFSFGDYNYEQGYLLTGYLISDNKYFCTNSHTDMNVYTNTDLYGFVIPCFRDTDFDGNFDKLTSYLDVEASGNFALGKNPLPYTKTIGQFGDAKGFKMQLLYQGILKNGINISYREYSNNMARPAFTQDVKYELGGDGTTIIGFKGARIEVYNANNTELKYKVIKGFAK